MSGLEPEHDNFLLFVSVEFSQMIEEMDGAGTNSP